MHVHLSSYILCHVEWKHVQPGGTKFPHSSTLLNVTMINKRLNKTQLQFHLWYPTTTVWSERGTQKKAWSDGRRENVEDN